VTGGRHGDRQGRVARPADGFEEELGVRGKGRALVDDRSRLPPGQPGQAGGSEPVDDLAGLSPLRLLGLPDEAAEFEQVVDLVP